MHEQLRQAPNLIVLDKRTGRFLAKDTAPTVGGMLHGQWSSPSMGTVHGRKLVFLGGGDGICYAFEALTAVPNARLILKTAWWADCNPPAYRSAAGVDMIRHYVLGDVRRKDTLNTVNDGSFVGVSEIVATPVFYQDRVLCGRSGVTPSMVVGAGLWSVWRRPGQATAPRPARFGGTRGSTARSPRSRLPTGSSTWRTSRATCTAWMPRRARPTGSMMLRAG